MAKITFLKLTIFNFFIVLNEAVAQSNETTQLFFWEKHEWQIIIFFTITIMICSLYIRKNYKLVKGKESFQFFQFILYLTFSYNSLATESYIRIFVYFDQPYERNFQTFLIFIEKFSYDCLVWFMPLQVALLVALVKLTKRKQALIPS